MVQAAWIWWTGCLLCECNPSPQASCFCVSNWQDCSAFIFDFYSLLSVWKDYSRERERENKTKQSVRPAFSAASFLFGSAGSTRHLNLCAEPHQALEPLSWWQKRPALLASVVCTHGTWGTVQDTLSMSLEEKNQAGMQHWLLNSRGRSQGSRVCCGQQDESSAVHPAKWPGSNWGQTSPRGSLVPARGPYSKALHCSASIRYGWDLASARRPLSASRCQGCPRWWPGSRSCALKGHCSRATGVIPMWDGGAGMLTSLLEVDEIAALFLNRFFPLRAGNFSSFF